MSKEEIRKFQDDLRISYSEISVFLSCGLKYRFMYVERRPYERLSIALPFGRAIHSCIQRFYRSLMENKVESLPVLQELFEDTICIAINHSDVPIVFKKDAPELESAIRMGKALMKVFYESVDLGDIEILGVELPLSARLYTENGEATDFKLVGVIDLLLRDTDGELIVVDHKTSSKPCSQSTIDEDLQFSSYSYLVASNKYFPFSATVNCRLDVLRKLKNPKLEQYHTVRTAEQRKRFAKIANAVLSGVEKGVFIPCRSWLCTDCSFIDACEAW